MEDTRLDIFEAVTTYDPDDVKRVLGSDPASVNRRNDNGLSALYTAAMYGNEQAVLFLLQKGADLDIFACAYLEKNFQGKRLLQEEPSLVYARTADGRTPLHYAAEKGNFDFAGILIDYGADVNARDRNGGTALMEASHGGPWKPEPALDIIQLLAANGAEVDLYIASGIGNTVLLMKALEARLDLVNSYDDNGHTALFHAARNNHLQAVKVLMEHGAEVDKACLDGQTPLSTAALHLLSGQSDQALIQYIIAKGAPYDIHTAAALGDVDQISSLMSKDPSLANKELRGLKPADYAVHCWQVAALRRLLEAGADANLTDGMGRSLLSKCSQNEDLRRVLLEYGAEE